MKFKIICDFCSQIMRISVSGLIWIMRTVSVLIWRKIDLRSPCSLYSLNGLHPELCSTISPWEEVDLRLKKRLRSTRLPLQIRNIFSFLVYYFLFQNQLNVPNEDKDFFEKNKTKLCTRKICCYLFNNADQKIFFLDVVCIHTFPSPKKQNYGT